MGTETSKIALNVYLRTANQQMSLPERHVDDITDMRRSCRFRRPLGLSSRLLKVPNLPSVLFEYYFISSSPLAFLESMLL